MIEIIIILFLVILSAVFSAAETAYTTLSLIQLQSIKKKGALGVLVYKLAENQAKLVTTILIGNNISNISASVLTTKFVLDRYGNAGLALSTGIITVIVLIFAEILPKQIAILNNEFIAIFTSIFLNTLVLLFTPLIYIINGIVKIFLKLFKIKKRQKITKESIRHMLTLAENLGILENDDRIFMQKMLHIDEVRASEIATHRTDVFSLSSEIKMKNALKLIKNEGYSRIPVYKGGNPEQIIGILIVKDLIELSKKNLEKTVDKFVKPIIFVQQNKKIKDILVILRKTQKTMAVVIDEYGGFFGILTIEDIVEKVFGAISDEYDTPEHFIEQIDNNTYRILGETPFDDIEEIIGIEIEHKEYINTIGGYIMDLIDRIPHEGERVYTEHGEYMIEEVFKNKIEKIILTKSK